MKTKFKISIVFIFGFVLILICCSKDSKKNDAVTFTCSGDCNNITINVSGESGQFHVDESCHTELENGDITKSTCTGTRTYLNNGHVYHYSSIVNYKTCKYFITVDGIGTCGDKDAGN